MILSWPSHLSWDAHTLSSSRITSVSYLLLLFPAPQAAEVLLQGRQVNTWGSTHDSRVTHSHTQLLTACLFSLHLTNSHADCTAFCNFWPCFIKQLKQSRTQTGFSHMSTTAQYVKTAMVWWFYKNVVSSNPTQTDFFIQHFFIIYILYEFIHIHKGGTTCLTG